MAEGDVFLLRAVAEARRKRVPKEVFERGRSGRSREELKREIARLETELSRTEDLVRVLRCAPWVKAETDVPPKGDPSRAKRPKSPRRKRAKKKSPESDPRADRHAHPEGPAPAGGPGGDG